MCDVPEKNFVIIYDTNPVATDVLVRFFDLLNIISCIAQDLKSLLEFINHKHCELVITNIKDQKILEKIRAQNPEIKIVIFSSYDLTKDQLPSADLILKKPILFSEFEEKIRELFS